MQNFIKDDLIIPGQKSEAEVAEDTSPGFGDNVSAAFYLGPGNAILRSQKQQEITGKGTNPVNLLLDYWQAPTQSEISNTAEFFENPESIDEIINMDIPTNIIADSKSISDLKVRAAMFQAEKDLLDVVNDPNNGLSEIAAQLVGYNLDVFNLIPIGTLAGITAKTAKGIAIGALKGGASTGLSVAASEALLVQPTSEVKTLEDSLIETVVGTTIGTVLGGSVAGLGAARVNRIAKMYESVLKEESPEIYKTMKDNNIDFIETTEDVLRNDGNMSAAQRGAWKKAGLADIAYLPEGLARGIAATGFWSSPVIYGMTRTSSPTTKVVAQNFFSKNLKVGFEIQENIASDASLEAKIRLNEEKFQTEHVEELQNLVYTSNGVNKDSTFSKTIQDFKQAINKSDISAEEIDSLFDHLLNGSKTIDDMPVLIRDQMDNLYTNYSNYVLKVWDNAFKRNLVDTPTPRLGPDGRIRDIHRQWDIPKVLANPKLVKEKIKGSIEKDLLNQGYIKKDGKFLLKDKDTGKISDIKDETRIKLDTDKVYRHIIEGRSELDIPPDDGKSPLVGFFRSSDIIPNYAPNKPRQLIIPNSEVSEFIKHSAINNAFRPIQNLARQVEFAKWLEEMKEKGLIDFRVNTIDDLKLFIKGEYNEAISKLDPSSKEAKELQEELKQVIGKDGWLDSSLRVLMGNYKVGTGNPKVDKFFDYWMFYQVLNKLGRVTISSIPDAARVMMAHPASNFMAKGLIAGISAIFANKNVAKNKAVLKKAGVSIDMTMNTMYKLMLRGDNQTNPLSKGEIAKDFVARFFMNASGMAPWNNFWRGVSAHMSSDATISAGEILASGKQLKEWQRQRLRAIGFSDADAIKLYKEWKTHPNNTSHLGLKLIGESGLSEESLEKLALAVQKEIDNTILIPGAGDRPFWAMRTDYGALINQFQTFNQAATTRYTLPALQDIAAMRTMKAEAMKVALKRLSWMMGAISMAALSIEIKSRLSKGHGVDWTPEKFLGQGLAASGINGYFISKGIDLYATLTNSMADRYGDRNIYSNLGPTAGTVADIVQTAGPMLDGKPQSREKIMRLAPLRNLDLVRFPLDISMDYLGVLPKKDSPEYEKKKQEYLRSKRDIKKIDEAEQEANAFNPIDFILKEDK